MAVPTNPAPNLSTVTTLTAAPRRSPNLNPESRMARPGKLGHRHPFQNHEKERQGLVPAFPMPRRLLRRLELLH